MHKSILWYAIVYTVLYFITPIKNYNTKYKWNLSLFRTPRIIFWDVPLLYEISLHHICWKTLVVYCTEEQQLERLLARENSSDVMSHGGVESISAVCQSHTHIYSYTYIHT